MGGELGGIDEDAEDDEVGAVAGGADQRGMSLMQGAHGGDEADAPTVTADGVEGGAGFGNSFGFEHGGGIRVPHR